MWQMGPSSSLNGPLYRCRPGLGGALTPDSQSEPYGSPLLFSWLKRSASTLPEETHSRHRSARLSVSVKPRAIHSTTSWQSALREPSGTANRISGRHLRYMQKPARAPTTE
jgi:hypothetical protein